jgi:hypothetical protein
MPYIHHRIIQTHDFLFGADIDAKFSSSNHDILNHTSSNQMASSKKNWSSNIPKSYITRTKVDISRGDKSRETSNAAPLSTQGYVAAEVERVGKISGVSLAAEKKVGMASHGQPSVVELPRNPWVFQGN